MPRESTLAELHLIGQLQGASQFSHNQLFCCWSFHTGGGWQLIQGSEQGQTQVDCPVYDSEQDSCRRHAAVIWSHPLDVHYNVKSITGWPRLAVQVFCVDQFGRVDLCGYGFCHVPSSPGHHQVTCVTWRPTGTWADECRRLLVGGGVQLRELGLVHASGVDRYRLQTVSAGQVHVEFNVILRNFDKFGVEC